MIKKNWLYISGFLLVLLCACQRPDPNILIFLTDDLGYGDLGCYGNPIIKTPNFDELAQDGIRFTDFHAAGTVCSPSRASLLTGKHPYRLGFYYILGGGAYLSEDEVTLPELLKSNGYQTFFAGKWHLTHFNRESEPDPGDHGFDYWYATVLNAFDGPESPSGFYRNGEPVGEQNKWYCDLIVDEAIAWLKSDPDHDQPFFMELCTHGPHTPINPPKEFSDLYDNEEVDSLEDEISYGYVERRHDKNIEPNKKYYYGTVTQIDLAFGRLMTALDEMNLADQTLVFLTSDNGPEYPVNYLESKGQWDDPIRDRCFGTPGPLKGMKRFTDEGGHRVPAIIRWPSQIRGGKSSSALLNGTDLLPSICDLTGVELPVGLQLDGENMAKALLGHPQSRKNPIVWNAPVHEYEFVPSMTMRDGDWLLVAWFNEKDPDELWMNWIKSAGPQRYELYNLKQDIGQQHDLSGDETEQVNQMAKRLEEIWADIQTEAPVHPNWKAH